MKRVFALLIVATLVFSACENMPKGHTAPQPVLKPEISVKELSSVKDPVCGMELSDGMVEDTLRYQSKLFGFCSAGCKDEFVKDPRKYLSQK